MRPFSLVTTMTVLLNKKQVIATLKLLLAKKCEYNLDKRNNKSNEEESISDYFLRTL